MGAAANSENIKLRQNALLLKVCGMRQPENIQEILALKPDYLGFIFYPKSTRFVGDEIPADSLKNMPATTCKVGVFVNETYETIRQTAEKYKLEAVQLHGEELPELCQQLKETGLLVLKAFSVDDAFAFETLEAYEGTCDYYLFDTKGNDYGGNGVRFNWDILKNYQGETPFFLSGGIDLAHVDQIKRLELPLLKGIDINSRFELSPALKDSAKVQAFFGKIRQA
ncbi:N-(5'-phosphoribosyl)anthranilate isomerase [Adhaeribacter aerolatus]|uniref:N-(5'-phosphoribosyl)anthranilate isomerase n=1 Tax=Adhaeribacter aerolatus TaxID=670289 RepID=A0A512AY86_9BACT|nr:phosphoribosylanthranilate isomerase [Adhaeribacter aerolatus]GEO04676.1 N-(5'-phosphoribosyl)anthranilate isomerase [Adhaeribacter aerolatus]